MRYKESHMIYTSIYCNFKLSYTGDVKKKKKNNVNIFIRVSLLE